MKKPVSFLLFTFILGFFTFSYVLAQKQQPLTKVLSSKIHQYISQIKNGLSNKLEEASSDKLQVRDNGGAKGYSGGYGHGAITLDPVSIISLLALGAFLINNILQLLRANGSGRNIEAYDINFPMELSHLAFGAFKKKASLGQNRVHKEYEDEGPSFSQFFENVGSLYYLSPKKRNICIKKVVCNYMYSQQSRQDNVNPNNFKNKVFDFMLSTITKFVAPEINTDGKVELCSKFDKLCSDSLLHDAKVTTENKVYSTVTSFISNLALQTFMNG